MTSEAETAENDRGDERAALLREVFDCGACAHDGLGFSRAANGRMYKFPPTIGALGTAPILLVGTNPRIDSEGTGNRWLHERLMSDVRTFANLAANRLPDGDRYISTGCRERHYRLHARIADAAFPGVPFEEVAAVTEIHLCATRNSSGLRRGWSRCADRYLARTVALVRPRVIVAIGAHARDYLAPRCRSVQGGCVLVAGGVKIPVVDVPHPNSWGPREERTATAIEEIETILAGRE